MMFSQFGLSDELVNVLSALGYNQPTPIQQQAIGPVLSGRDILAAAPTGSGKTAAFGLPLLSLLAQGKSQSGRARALVLVPTRELALQVAEVLDKFAHVHALRTGVVIGGVEINRQLRQLKDGCDVLVACPGRLLHLHQGKHIDLSGVHHVVLDEADRMLDMGFIDDIKKILRALPKQRQHLLFSATFSPEIRRLAEGLLHDPVSIEAAPPNQTPKKLQHYVHPCATGQKPAVLAQLIKHHQWPQVLVFTRTKHVANRLSEWLEAQHIGAAAIHGNKSQNARQRALGDFRRGTLQVLVATDIAARGIDIAELPAVVNYELPNQAEDYVHRIGRSGRAAAAGLAVSLMSDDEKPLVKAIEKLMKSRLSVQPLPKFSQPTEQGSGLDLRWRRPEQAQGEGKARNKGPRRAPKAQDKREQGRANANEKRPHHGKPKAAEQGKPKGKARFDEKAKGVDKARGPKPKRGAAKPNSNRDASPWGNSKHSN